MPSFRSRSSTSRRAVRLSQQRYTVSFAYGVTDSIDLAAVVPTVDTHVDLSGYLVSTESGARQIAYHASASGREAPGTKPNSATSQPAGPV